MAGKNQKVSLTFRVDKGVLEHNNRNFIAKNVDRERISENITYKQENLRDKYHELFDKALEEYNAKTVLTAEFQITMSISKRDKRRKPFTKSLSKSAIKITAE